MALFAEGFVKYPDELPCPQVDTDLKPRERRYISDIGEVKRLRRFQSTFQAERQKISFIFTRAQAEEFQKWYKEEIIEGGAWFYADWPILHKEKRISYRFVTRPVWEFLANGVYHVTASVETHERKVGRAANVYTSKIYPLYFSDGITETHGTIDEARMPPKYAAKDDISASQISIVEATKKGWIFSKYQLSDDISASKITIVDATLRRWIYSKYQLSDDISASHITVSAEVTSRRIDYDRDTDRITASQITIIAGEKT